jgi:hypothetical protein
VLELLDPLLRDEVVQFLGLFRFDAVGARQQRGAANAVDLVRVIQTEELRLTG